MIRRSRGYAPLPFMVSTPWKGQVIAAGGELKNTFCIGVDNRFYPSPYVGDLEDLRTVKALKETIGRWKHFWKYSRKWWSVTFIQNIIPQWWPRNWGFPF